MADDEERVLEQQIEVQLKEQKESLTALDEALVSDPTNSELLAVHEELLLAIRDAEDGLFHLKRSRLLQEADILLLAQSSKSTDQAVEVESLDPRDVEAEPLEQKPYLVGSKWRFRHSDGRWYNGNIVELDGSNARMSFLTPTSESMMICKFFLQQRCRFGSDCRLSHGVDVPLSSLKRYIPTIWQQSMVGSNVWAVSDTTAGIWREAHLESWDDILGLGQVVFRDDGSSAKLGSEAFSLSEFAQMSEEEEDGSTSEHSDSSDYDEEDSSQGVGFLEATTLQRGIQTDTAVFAKWEHHTRGIASKMMANMGYREGMGLGASGQGIVDPVSVKVLPEKQALGHVDGSLQGKDTGEKREKKRSRGGKRKRDKKFAAEARARKIEEELNAEVMEEAMNPDVFSFINKQLMQANGSSKKRQSRSEVRTEDRATLIACDDKVKNLQIQVEKLEEMVNRNRKEKPVYEAFLRKLNETRKSLADAVAAHASVLTAVSSKENEKRWLKF